MSALWEGVDIFQTFRDAINVALLSLGNKLFAASGDPRALPDVKQEIAEFKSFRDKCEYFKRQICSNGSNPVSMGLRRTTDRNGLVFNFYDYSQSNWVVYFHIDNKFKKFTSVLAHSDTDPGPSPLRDELIKVMEDFREIP